MEKSFKAGEIILQVGASGEEAYLINSGKVEVFRITNGKKIVLAHLAENQLFGEMSMIDDRPRSANVRAIEDTRVTVLTRAEFNELFYVNPELLTSFMKNIFERLRHSNQSVIDLTANMTTQNYSGSQVVITGATPLAKQALPGGGKVINKFPFKIGRKTTSFTSDLFSFNDLYLEDKAPYNVSRNHLSLQYSKNKFTVLDRGSSLGTIVNDSRIGGPSKNHEIELARKKESTITVGSAGSPFVFKVKVP